MDENPDLAELRRYNDPHPGWEYVCENHPRGSNACLKCVCGHNWMVFWEQGDTRKEGE